MTARVLVTNFLGCTLMQPKIQINRGGYTRKSQILLFRAALRSLGRGPNRSHVRRRDRDREECECSATTTTATFERQSTVYFPSASQSLAVATTTTPPPLPQWRTPRERAAERASKRHVATAQLIRDGQDNETRPPSWNKPDVRSKYFI